MWGGFVHNKVLLERVLGGFREAGATVREEFPVRIGPHRGFIDGFVQIGDRVIAVEAECSADRVRNDVRKAEAPAATELWIVTPDSETARSARQRLGRKPHEKFSGHSICVLTLGQAMQRLTNCFPKKSDLTDRRTSRKQSATEGLL